ncbi:AAA family ATPase [Sphingobacterium paramultivorum]|uniref:AAA family ATPase n=1 Tax=Sphingobacterium paramultivorum TaxID=2886510 RepID=A0A7G5E1Q8_9SPHI|nr:AAA family ATPase [Sphingobacterium paramultivorum]QMV67933.1 AAA family ATPase [Sphingobacterium paramultivorum]WSO16833.1 AAA family ATPase [Sphingobacterium paramultivorum]
MKIKSFKIINLYGYRTININFDNPVKILIGENGLGKTTILNIIYYTLSKNFLRLSKINFESIEVVFDSKNKISFTKSILLKHLSLDKENLGSHFHEYLSKLSNENAKKLRNIIYDANIPDQHKRIELKNILRQIGININAPTMYIFDMVQKYFDELDGNKFYDTIKVIEKVVDAKILYFPTYRRIEEDIKNIGYYNKEDIERLKRYGNKNIPYLDSDESKDVIQFGMQDVQERIENITSQITHASMIGFSDITAQMLHQLLTDYPNLKSKKRVKEDFDKLNIMLDRIGQTLSPEDRQKINDFIKVGKTDNKGLIFFIDQLIELYNNLEDQDISIKKFINVCNNYLTEKKYVYNDREVILNIQHQNPKYLEQNLSNIIDLNKLSSGEKQIVSLFSKIYLEEDKRFIVLFDEPELSLSIFWQQRLLSDIIDSGKCDLLFAVTHSPFIYENELFDQTYVLRDYIS